MAGGALGSLIGGEGRREAAGRARQLIAAADAGREAMLKAAFGAGSAKARGAFRETLDAVVVLLRERAKDATDAGDAAAAMRALRAIPAVETAKTATEVNAIPQLLALEVMRAVAGDP